MARNSRTKVNQNDKWGRSVAETDRKQFRFGIAELSDDQKRELVRQLLDMGVPMDCWRFNSKAVWLNEDQTDAAMAIKLLIKT